MVIASNMADTRIERFDSQTTLERLRVLEDKVGKLEALAILAAKK